MEDNDINRAMLTEILSPEYSVLEAENGREALSGASDFVAKPYIAQVILHRAASIIHLRETAAMINLIQDDRLTGLFSKEFFYQKVNEVLVLHPDHRYDIVCSDIDNFKLINDIFGISAGNRLLCSIADQVEEQINSMSKKSVSIKWGVYPITNNNVPAEQMCDRAFFAIRSIKGRYGTRFALYDDKLPLQMGSYAALRVYSAV